MRSIRKVLSLLLALLLVMNLGTPAFAAETPSVTLTVDKTDVSVGDTVTVTVGSTGISDVFGMGFKVYADQTVYEVESIETTWTSNNQLEAKGWIKIATLSSTGNTLTPPEPIAVIKLKAKAAAETSSISLSSLEVTKTGADGTSVEIVTVTSPEAITTVVKESVVAVTGITLDKSELALTVGGTGTLAATVTPENATDKTVTWTSSDESVATVAEDGTVTAKAVGSATITAKAGDVEATCTVTVTEKPEENPVTGYTVTMPADTSVITGETVSVPVTVGHADGTGYDAFDMTFTYDASALELTSTAIEGLTVTPGDGTVQVHGYGADKDAGSTAFTLTFTALAAQESTITLTSAKIDNSGHAVSDNAPEATLLDADTKVTVSGYPVTLPEGFTGDSVAAPGEDYTFSEPEDYYDYEITVTVGGESVTPTDNEDGSYTIPGADITGEIVITATKEGKTFSVTLGDDMTGAETAQYMSDYTATLTQAEGYTYEVTVTIGGNTYTGYSVAEGVYTIPGADITGEIVFTVTKTEVETPDPETYNVTFQGSGAGDAEGLATATVGKSYQFRIPPVEGYIYTVTATVNGNPVTVTDVGATGMGAPGVYGIAAADITGDIVITVEKALDIEVSVSNYVSVDGGTVFLVLVDGALDAYAYDGSAMFYSEAYEAWCYLVIAEGEFTADAAKAKITATDTSFVTVSATTDVNMSGLTDINDAQLVYDIYNGRYTDFTIVVMQKFLNADVNVDKTVNVSDATAVVTAIISAK